MSSLAVELLLMSSGLSRFGDLSQKLGAWSLKNMQPVVITRQRGSNEKIVLVASWEM